MLFKVKPSLHQAFLDVTGVTDLYFVHTLLHNTPKFIIYRSISMNYDIFDASFFGNIPLQYYIFSVFRLSQDTVATFIRWGGWSSYRHMYLSSLNLTVKTALKSVNFRRTYRKNKLALFMAHGVLTDATCAVFPSSTTNCSSLLSLLTSTSWCSTASSVSDWEPAAPARADRPSWSSGSDLKLYAHWWAYQITRH